MNVGGDERHELVVDRLVVAIQLALVFVLIRTNQLLVLLQRITASGIRKQKRASATIDDVIVPYFLIKSLNVMRSLLWCLVGCSLPSATPCKNTYNTNIMQTM